VISWLAVIVGGAVPLAVLAAIARWRGGLRPRRVVPRRQARRRRGKRVSLAWLGPNLGKPEDEGEAEALASASEADGAPACPTCGHPIVEGAMFCRSCGTRLQR